MRNGNPPTLVEIPIRFRVKHLLYLQAAVMFWLTAFFSGAAWQTTRHIADLRAMKKALATGAAGRVVSVPAGPATVLSGIRINPAETLNFHFEGDAAEFIGTSSISSDAITGDGISAAIISKIIFDETGSWVIDPP